MSSEPPLPPSAQVVAEVIGREKTLLLARTICHRHFYVPKVYPIGHWIPALVGRETAALLQHTFGGELVDLAKCTSLARAERNKEIVRDILAGDLLHTVAQRYRLTPRAISYVLEANRFKVGMGSPVLFPKPTPPPPPIGSSDPAPLRVRGNSQRLARD